MMGAQNQLRRQAHLRRTGTGPGMGVPNNNIAALNGGQVPQGGRPNIPTQTFLPNRNPYPGQGMGKSGSQGPNTGQNPMLARMNQQGNRPNIPSQIFLPNRNPYPGQGTGKGGSSTGQNLTQMLGGNGVGAPAPSPMGFPQPPKGGIGTAAPPPVGVPQPAPTSAAPPPMAPPAQQPPQGQNPFPGIPTGPPQNRPDLDFRKREIEQAFQSGQITSQQAVQAYNQLQQDVNRPQGGTPISSDYYAPTGPVQDMLFNLFTGGPGGFMPEAGNSPYLASLAQGQVPEATQAWMNDILGRQQAAAAERFGASGAGRGSDVESYIAREQGQTVNQFGNDIVNRAIAANQLQGNYQQGALANYLGLGSGLMGSETAQNQQAFQLAFGEFLRQQGLPPDLANLLAVVGNTPGATHTTTTPGTDIAAAGIGAGTNYLNYLANQFGNQQPVQQQQTPQINPGALGGLAR